MAAFGEGNTDRFKAIVSCAPVIDQQSEYGTEDNSWSDRWFYGKPWEHPADAWRQSPLANVAKAKTPFLLIQGAKKMLSIPWVRVRKCIARCARPACTWKWCSTRGKIMGLWAAPCMDCPARSLGMDSMFANAWSPSPQRLPAELPDSVGGVFSLL